jgi:hypothetical protein
MEFWLNKKLHDGCDTALADGYHNVFDEFPNKSSIWAVKFHSSAYPGELFNAQIGYLASINFRPRLSKCPSFILLICESI